jgi:hypothetical protein
VKDWREYDFFRTTGGLSASDDSPESVIAYDCELVLGCPPLVERVQLIPDRIEKARRWVEAYPYLSRWMPSSGVAIERPELAPLIPTACLLAGWFPAHWLAGSKAARLSIVRSLRRAYTNTRPLNLHPYPLSQDYGHVLSLASDKERHLWALLVLDRTERHHRLVARFSQALWELGIYPDKSEPARKKRYVDAVRALKRLACHRLGNLPIAERDVLASQVAHLKGGLSSNKLWRARKAVSADFQARRYLISF